MRLRQAAVDEVRRPRVASAIVGIVSGLRWTAQAKTDRDAAVCIAIYAPRD